MAMPRTKPSRAVTAVERRVLLKCGHQAGLVDGRTVGIAQDCGRSSTVAPYRPLTFVTQVSGSLNTSGDSWDLIIALESVLPLDESAPVAVCINGRRAAPPEDCGGLREAAELAEVLEDPTHFDLDEINKALTEALTDR
jgi:hypothetical protein